ncbi:hypothetical protein RJ641_019109 [Dillenia turbinata]|uniref:Uncharacterized protein n=1 Tax=Dillenia turbinata TaxID=194707 RepID=A0AAN8Z0H9_9MAGN
MTRLISKFLILFTILTIFSSSLASVSYPGLKSPLPKPISDLKDSIAKGLGLQADEFKISGSVAYEFDIEIDNKLLGDVNKWEYVDLPIFRMESPVVGGEEKGLVERRKRVDDALPVLTPFQLAGPMEIWIRDAKDMRISLPHDVDAGVLKKVILADAAVVTVKGARSVSLRHPLNLPLPLNRTNSGFASGLLTLAERLRHSSCTQGAALLSLHIVGPTSLTSPSPSSSSSNRLKLRRLAPGLVELSSPTKTNTLDSYSAIDVQADAPSLLTPSGFTTMWPLASINGSNPNLLGFESLLSSVLGPKANEMRSFKLLKADVSAQTFLKLNFGIPAWRTKPETLRMHFEVLAKIDRDKVVPERVTQVNPVLVEDTVAPNVLQGNVTMSRVPIYQPP